MYPKPFVPTVGQLRNHWAPKTTESSCEDFVAVEGLTVFWYETERYEVEGGDTNPIFPVFR